MAIRVNPMLVSELEKYGAEDVQNCYHCGNCSAMCPFSKDPYTLPRRSMRDLQMGLEKRLESGLEPWLCYYCGECSAECPRDAEPGETMMSLRRWLTARYDFTGIGRMFYRHPATEIVAVVVVFLLTALAFSLWGILGGNIDAYGDARNAFLPSSSIHIFDWSMAGVLLAFLLPNCTRMWWFTIGRETLGHDRRARLPIWAYVKAVYLLPLHFITQKRYAECEHKRPWVVHLILMLSYVTMLVLIMFFIGEMASGPSIDLRFHIFGYLATVGLIGTSIWALRGRVKKQEVQYQHSHESDWMFLYLLLLVAATGIAQHIFHRVGLYAAANVTYVVHIAAVVPMLGLEVPFSKWAHLAYRPLAMYFAQVRTQEVPVEGKVPAGAETAPVA
jgi:ferredoxin